jgi:hypothetical protein
MDLMLQKENICTVYEENICKDRYNVEKEKYLDSHMYETTVEIHCTSE